jgi:glycosyltransferase involved in cell wall biosynthesis
MREETSERISVGVFVDLKRDLSASGQVTCWDRLARAAAGEADRIAIDVHFLGDRETEEPLAPNVHILTHRPVLETARLGLGGMPADTDLSPLHPRVVGRLGRYDVLHTTDAFFSLARTVLFFGKLLSKPLSSSVHTDVPRYTRIFAGQILGRSGMFRRWLLDGLRLDERLGRRMQRRLERYLSRCDRVLVSSPEDLERLKGSVEPGRLSFLRRGLDKDSFHPRRRDRRRLAAAHGIGEEEFVVLFVGRIDDSKNPLVLARALRRLLDEGRSPRLLLVGSGGREGEIRRLLGDRAVFAGILPQSELGRVYASADLFAFPSETEVLPNVVLEARASGLPVAVSGRAGAAQMVEAPGQDGFVIDGDAGEWAAAIRWAMDHAAERKRMGESARAAAERTWPSWADVLRNDLLPVWTAMARRRPLERH